VVPEKLNGEFIPEKQDRISVILPFLQRVVRGRILLFLQLNKALTG